MAELFAGSFGALGFTGGRAPSLFNGGLDAYAVFMVAATVGTAYLELLTVDDVNQTWLNTAEGKAKYSPGATLQFDPLDIAAKAGSYDLRSAEIYNGRLAMLAITGFAVQEFLWAKPVVEQTPWFFGR